MLRLAVTAPLASRTSAVRKAQRLGRHNRGLRLEQRQEASGEGRARAKCFRGRRAPRRKITEKLQIGRDPGSQLSRFAITIRRNDRFGRASIACKARRSLLAPQHRGFQFESNIIVRLSGKKGPG